MKLTKSYLKQVIKEELNKLNEVEQVDMPLVSTSHRVAPQFTTPGVKEGAKGYINFEAVKKAVEQAKGKMPKGELSMFLNFMKGADEEANEPLYDELMRSVGVTP